MSEQLLNALDRYYDTFDDSFPMATMSGIGEKEVIEIINRCVSEKKDVYSLGYLSLSEDVMY